MGLTIARNVYYFQSYNLAIAIAMACVQDANKEAHIANDNEKGLEEDLAKLKVKQELTKVAKLKGDSITWRAQSPRLMWLLSNLNCKFYSKKNVV